ncbi:MAG TPA: hypothetical protein VKT99_24140, partial [Xanthobacteraceae bacterium]|nr:hypothetical protein [Xanthobacteraceae bacterium]
SIQAIKAVSDRGLAAFHVLPRSKFKRVFHRAWPDLQRMKLLLPGGAVLPGQFPPSHYLEAPQARARLTQVGRAGFGT